MKNKIERQKRMSDMSSMIGEKALLIFGKNVKMVRSGNYNYNFDLASGYFERWGKNKEDDPDFSPFGPEILDIEVSTICNGINGKPCPFCYKGNTCKGSNMSLETFQKILLKMPQTLLRLHLALGILIPILICLRCSNFVVLIIIIRSFPMLRSMVGILPMNMLNF
jgi:hypothetical protein